MNLLKIFQKKITFAKSLKSLPFFAFLLLSHFSNAQCADPGPPPDFTCPAQPVQVEELILDGTGLRTLLWFQDDDAGPTGNNTGGYIPPFTGGSNASPGTCDSLPEHVNYGTSGPDNDQEATAVGIVRSLGYSEARVLDDTGFNLPTAGNANGRDNGQQDGWLLLPSQVNSVNFQLGGPGGNDASALWLGTGCDDMVFQGLNPSGPTNANTNVSVDLTTLPGTLRTVSTPNCGEFKVLRIRFYHQDNNTAASTVVSYNICGNGLVTVPTQFLYPATSVDDDVLPVVNEVPTGQLANVLLDDNDVAWRIPADCTMEPTQVFTNFDCFAVTPADPMVVCDVCCSFEATCPADLSLGTFDCNTLADIPAMPMVMTSVDGDITVDNADGDYQIEVGDTPCGDIVVNTSDNISMPDVCADGGQVIIRTVVVFDDLNGNGTFDAATEEMPVTCNFTITITEDTTPPMITCPADVTIECDEDISPASNGMATATDNCSSMMEIDITFDDSSTQAATGCGQYEYTITRTWTATDACGNMATCTQTINVEDTTPAVIKCPAVVTIECDADTSPASNGTATATDNCSEDAEITITFSDVSTQTAAGCGQFNFVITRTWTATDVCGNASTCTQVITVNDTTAPVISCPADQTLVCNTDPLPSATNITDFIAIGGAVVDNCADLSELSVSFVDFPANQAMLDFCSADAADRTLTRTYTVTDICGNANTCEQLFVYDQSVINPVITATPPDQTVDCAVNAIPQAHLLEFETDCAVLSTTVVSEANSSGTTGCPGSTVQYTYTVTDVCGRSVSATQTYTIINEGPEFVCPVDICIIECPADTDMIQAQFDAYADLATVNTSCSENNEVSITNTFNPNSFIPQNCNNPTIAVENAVSYQIVTFRATDLCGRSSTCTALVVIQDNDSPVLTGSISAGIADCADSDQQSAYLNWANAAINNISATDVCSNGAVDISFSPASPNIDCSDGLATTNVSFTATDACGNQSIFTANYQIIDYDQIPMATVSGSLMTEENEPVELVEVSVEGGLFDNAMMTSADGDFQFALEMNQNYAITPVRNDDPLNGITSYDLILLGQHLLGYQELDSPYKLIAADINRSGNLSILDMIYLRRMILLIDDAFPNNTSWRFVDADYVFPNASNPFASTFPELVSINNLSQDMLHDFVAIKVGDLNGSATSALVSVEGDTRTSKELTFQVKDQRLAANQTYTIDFMAKDFNDILGYQFTLDFDSDLLTMVDINAGVLENLTAENFGNRAKDGLLTASWTTFEPISIADDATLFSITFQANSELKLSEVIELNSELTSSEAYSQSESLMNLGLSFNEENVTAGQGFRLLQNQPNPFSQETVIGFTLTEATAATLTIFDVSGKIVWTQTRDHDSGLNQITIAKDVLTGNGIYYYQLSTSTATATRKMVLVR